MKITYWYTILVYILIQFSGVAFGFELLMSLGVDQQQSVGIWTVISFGLGLLIVVFLLREDIKERHLTPDRVSRSSAVGWAISGIFMSLGAQYIAALIEVYALGIEIGSENTDMLVEIAKMTPIFILVTSVLGPIFEEIIFRQIIFGSLYKKFNFWIAAVLSSLIFAAVHMDFEHLLVYTALGVTFAYLYVKTKRIIVPIMAHVAMNSLVVIVRVIFADDIIKMQEQLEEIQAFSLFF